MGWKLCRTKTYTDRRATAGLTARRVRGAHVCLKIPIRPAFPCERDGEGGENLLWAVHAPEHTGVSDSHRLKPPEQQRESAMARAERYYAHLFKAAVRGMEMPSARDCPMGALRVTPRHRRSRETYSTDCKFRGDSGAGAHRIDDL
ncbi:hypothetical protein EVAR_37567_1 [Eumeta japonica]|uniref:Uncharacterized protein n=1 Tax=Eumeta variegata TaxID=151549 RepID=A0A4C1XVD1_EUMVA|nr:hypothetical protein EVAR_37567_1 [Eumeta japonica]